MNLSERTVAIILDEDGRAVMESAAVPFSESGTLLAAVQDTDDIGIWAQIDREDGPHVVLIRWEYILSVDFPAGETKTIGLRP